MKVQLVSHIFWFKFLLFLCIFNLHLMSPFIWVNNVRDRFEIRTDDCALLVRVEVPGSGLHLAIRVSVPLGVQLRVIFLFELVRDRSSLFKT